MIVTLSTTRRPATDLGYLLHKHPDRLQSFDVAMGAAHVFYPRADDDWCTVALMLEVDPVGLVRGRKGTAAEGFSLGQYVNDRPYAASSLVSVALGKVFRTALAGRCEARPELVDERLPLQVHVPALPARRGGVDLVTRLFEPLGWRVDAREVPLDPSRPDWGESRYVDLRLEGEMVLSRALRHLYVLLPVLDDAKHYWVTTEEVDKLVRAGQGWLGEHPEAELIARRYLAHRTVLTRSALDRLAEVDDTEPEAVVDADEPPLVGDEPDRPVPLATQRRGAVLAALRAERASTVADLGCGEGALLGPLLDDPAFSRVVGTDVSARTLQTAARRMRLDRMPEPKRARLELFQSSIVYSDARLAGLDAVVLMEVVEHVDEHRLPALEHSVFGAARPRTAVVTTPNVEHNVRFTTLPAGSMRHRDHRFEWTRAQFADWAWRVAGEFGYRVRFVPVGDDDPHVGPPTQMAVFTREGVR